MPIEFGPEVLSDFERSSRLEWLEATGTGGYASGTACGAHTRRYHGLLIVPLRPPVARHLLVSKLEEAIEVEGRTYLAGVNVYPGTIHPLGHRHLDSFRLDPHPVYTYRMGPARIEKSILCLHGRDATLVEYRVLEAPGPVRMWLRPLLAFRDHHALTHRNPTARTPAEVDPRCVTFQVYESVPPVHMTHEGGQWTGDEFWNHGLIYPRESERGLDDQEDLLCAGSLAFEAAAGTTISIVLSTERIDASRAQDLRDAELSRRARLVAGTDDERVAWLHRAADSFLVRRGDGMTVIAGYHWFEDWGRDTLISLPGLTIATGRLDIARQVLSTFAATIHGGLIPNRFPDTGHAAEYTSADSALWFAVCAERYLDASGDESAAVRVVLPALRSIVEGYRRGTLHNVRIDEDGLLTQGEEGLQLTWMDAKVGPWVVTPRMGRAVELNALWYNTLGLLHRLHEAGGDSRDARTVRGWMDQARSSFGRAFWYPEGRYLYDVAGPGPPDTSVRPNQVFALSLPRTMLDLEMARGVLAVVERLLVTPVGLRTLSAHDGAYRARYQGDRHERDAAYHQGTAWPYLLGHYITAYLNVHGRSDENVGRMRGLTHRLLDHLTEAGLGTVSEVYDGAPPHRPAGCISQAWSVAELLRVIVEDLGGRAT